MPSIDEATRAISRGDGFAITRMLVPCGESFQPSAKQKRREGAGRGVARLGRASLLGTMRHLPRSLDADTTGQGHTATQPH